MPPMRRGSLCSRTGDFQGTWLAQKVLQVQRLHQDTRFHNCMRWSRQRCLLQDMLRKTLGTPWIWVRKWIRIPTDRHIVSLPLNHTKLRGLTRFLCIAFQGRRNWQIVDRLPISIQRPLRHPRVRDVRDAAEWYLRQNNNWHVAQCGTRDAITAMNVIDRSIRCCPATDPTRKFTVARAMENYLGPRALVMDTHRHLFQRRGRHQ